MSENITAAITLNGEQVTKQPLIKSMRVVKKETLKLISDWISRSNDHSMVLDNFIPHLLDAVLLDYQRTAIPSAREPEVLSAMATIVNKLESHITSEVSASFTFIRFCVLLEKQIQPKWLRLDQILVFSAKVFFFLLRLSPFFRYLFSKFSRLHEIASVHGHTRNDKLLQ